IKGLQQLGFSRFITTPHIMVDLYPNSAVTIGNAFEKLKQAAGNDVPVQPAAEYMQDENFDRLLRENEPLLCISDKTVLVEFSFVTTPLNYKDRLFELQLRGYQPLLAHPERYLYFAGTRDVYDDLRSAGCQFACNILSFTGYYGKGPQELANYLLRNNCIDYLGTDLHHHRHLEALQKASMVMPIVQKLADSGRLLNRQL
ncbi:MAG TPA: CpsB/CapC family capsule biosynthesis tyrosine phosphatase, partial [Chitinophagaceae bacterium]|nr:CpsB/CapC family capsule biosynthesis tyrosine phosphatase [Chitinophagaceae bacterium]